MDADCWDHTLAWLHLWSRSERCAHRLAGNDAAVVGKPDDLDDPAVDD